MHCFIVILMGGWVKFVKRGGVWQIERGLSVELYGINPNVAQLDRM